MHDDRLTIRKFLLLQNFSLFLPNSIRIIIKNNYIIFVTYL